ncbi:MAG: helix-turn-helix domain-containing protein [Gammaproteobacteria bacterium]|nr:helix-turn-helix domain-containing protein [Gammaproteobacteria bacterium]
MNVEDRSFQTIGERLAYERESRGFTISDLRRRLNLSEQTLEALEANEFDKLPGASLTRGYLRMYCRALDIPEHEVLSEYDNIGHADPELAPPTNLRMSHNPDGPRMGVWSILIIASLAGLSGYYYLTIDADVDSPTDLGVLSGSAAPSRADSDESGQRDNLVEQVAQSIAQDLAKQTEALEKIQREANGAKPEQTSAQVSEDEPLTLEQVDQVVATPPSAAVEAEVNSEIIGEKLANQPVAQIAVGSEEAASVGEDKAAQIKDEALAALALEAVVPEPTDIDLANQSDATEANTETGDEAFEGQPSNVESNSVADSDVISQSAKTGDLDVLVLSSPEECWVEISDSRGKRTMYGMLAAGQTKRLEGRAPFKVFLGNAPPVKVAINQQGVGVPAPSNSRRTSRFDVSADASVRKR